MKISMIAAMSRNRIIGKNNDLPWHLPDDFGFFKSKTKGHHVIMGRKNFESLPTSFRPLPHRTNVVLTRNQEFTADGIIVVQNLEAALDIARSNHETEAFIIGGGQVYQLGLAYADCIYLTEIDAEIQGDTYFPNFNRDEWLETERKHHAIDDRHLFAFDFVTYHKQH
jgi:dihydrofolate reductase